MRDLEKKKQYLKKWKKDNPEKVKIINRRYRANNASYVLTAKRWRAEFPEKQQHSHLKCNYGITLDAYNEMLKQQNGVCAVCKSEPGKKRLHVDHDHNTDKVRALLCHRCNLALGCIDDDPVRLRALADYLERYA